MQVISGPVGREKIHFQAPPSDRLNVKIRNFISWWEGKSKNIDGLLRAGIAHLYFVTIHPFEDGNGRVARALTDMALAHDEKFPGRYYSLSSAIMAQRKLYYDVLEKTQKGILEITHWLLWFLECYLCAIQESKKSIFTALQKGYFWQKHAQTALNKNQQKVINRLLDAGTDGFEGGLTTRKYVSMTKTSRVTAYRNITDLVKKNILVSSKGKGRSASYELLPALIAKKDTSGNRGQVAIWKNSYLI